MASLSELLQLYPDALKNLMGQSQEQGPSPASQPTPSNIPLPNGGLTGQALQQAMAVGAAKAQPVTSLPQAPMQQASQQQDDSEDEAPTSKPAQQSKPLQSLVDMFKDVQQPKAPVEDPISKLLNQQNSDFETAKQQRDTSQLIALLGKAGSNIGAGLAGVHPDENAYKDLLALSNKPMEDLKTKQEGAQQAVKTNDLMQQLRNDMAKNDPNSAISMMGRQLAGEVAKQAKMNMPIPENLSFANMEKILPGFEKFAERRLAADTLAVNKQTQADQKAQDKQLMALKDVSGSLEQFRGQKAAQNAAEAMRLADTGLTLLNKYPDLNKMPPQQVALVINEIGKISTGGVPGHAELEALKPGTIQFKARQAYQSIANNPTGAKAGAFLQQYKDYLSDLKNTNQKLLTTRISRIVDAQAERLGEERASKLKDRYLQDFGVQPEDKEASDVQAKLPAIQAFMKANGIKDQDEAIKILKDAGKL